MTAHRKRLSSCLLAGPEHGCSSRSRRPRLCRCRLSSHSALPQARVSSPLARSALQPSHSPRCARLRLSRSSTRPWLISQFAFDGNRNAGRAAIVSSLARWQFGRASPVAVKPYVLDVEAIRLEPDVSALVRLVAVEQSAALPCAVFEPAFPRAFDARSMRAVADRRERHGDPGTRDVELV